MMSKKTILFIPLITILIVGAIFLFEKVRFAYFSSFQIFSFVVPANNSRYHPFTVKYAFSYNSSKKRIKLELNGDGELNAKKLELIKYEARKLKYTKDTNTVIEVTLTTETKYKEFINLLYICNEDKHKRFVLVKNRFVIFGPLVAPKNKFIKTISPHYVD
jgi:hypothetical protein